MDFLPLNWTLLGSPVNWAIIILMLIIAGQLLHVLLPQSPATNSNS